MKKVDGFNIMSILPEFFSESSEMLDEMERSLLNLEKDYSDNESIHAVFRAVHTIKGSSGMFGLREIEEFSHVLEHLLALVRKGDIEIDSKISDILIECHDYMGGLLNLFEHDYNAELTDEMSFVGQALISRLSMYLPSDECQPAELSVDEGKPEQNGVPSEEKRVTNEFWHISIRFCRDIYRSGLDPSSFINYLANVGEIVNIAVVYEDMPYNEEMDPESCYLGFEIDFRGDVGKEDIEKNFEFVRDEIDMRIIEPKSFISDYVKLLEELPESSMHLGEMLIRIGSLTESELEEALWLQGESDKGTRKKLGEILIDENMIHKPVIERAIEKQIDMKKNEENIRQTIRINADKVDVLINLVGELVITSANVKSLAERNEDSEMFESVSNMIRLVDDIRDSTMNVRMVQIGETFKKFERVIRDVSRKSGKEIDLIIHGSETDLDKTLVERISDPLMHLVRNSIDHGIGTPEERIASGKPGRGTIVINAYHETGSIIIEVSDDGEGLNRDKIFKRAVEMKMLKPEQDISDDDLFQLIFRPGFSTKDEVTSISGRGVGMDVVKRNIESMRGSVAIDSRESAGTTIRINLPLTLAIIDGFLFQIRDSFYIVPLDMVIECVEATSEELQAGDGGNFINLRGELLPFMRLSDFFLEEGGTGENEKIVVVESLRKKAGFVVDNLIGEFQTVVKPAGEIFKNLKWISGSTILGNGDVALILDVTKLIQYAGDMDNRVCRYH